MDAVFTHAQADFDKVFVKDDILHRSGLHKVLVSLPAFDRDAYRDAVKYEPHGLDLLFGRRFTVYENKKIENHSCAVALHYTHYNFCRIHKTLRVAPAMEAGLTDHVWEIKELVVLLDAYQSLAA